jgi:hypothetical protein
MSRLRSTPLILALCVSLVSAPALQAQNAIPAKPPADLRTTDVVLTPQGVLQGQLVDGAGGSLDGAQIALSRGSQVLYRGTTDAQGGFSVPGLTMGVYRIDGPGVTQACRVWSAEAAPPPAKPALVLVAGDPAVRGQMGMFCDPVTATALLLGVAGVTLSAITLAKVQELEDKSP